MTALASAGPSGGRGAAELLARHAERSGAPVTVVFEVTRRCNYDCTHCYQTHEAAPELGLAEIDRILGEVADEGTLFLTLMGGEFFMRRDADEILRAARRHGFAVKLLTTGHHVDDRRADLIRDLGAIAVDLSFYSGDPRVHDAVTRTDGSCERTLAAARRLRDRGVIVTLKTPLLSLNADSIASVARTARELGVAYAIDAKLTAREDGDLAPTAHRVDDATLRRFYTDEESGVWDVVREGFGGPGGPPAAPLQATPCRAGQVLASVDAQGLVYACNTLPVPCGDLRKESFRQIWRHSPTMARIRGLTWGQIEECRTCDVRAYCKRCHAMALIEDGKLDGPSREACRHAVTLRDLLRERGLAPADDTSLPPTYRDRRRPAALRVLPTH